jgi:tetratricopeptide (TPR) repeat protein
MDIRHGTRRTWLVGVALVLATLAAYCPLWHCGFVLFDDNDYVTSNEMVKRGLTWRGVAWAFSTVHASNWHPLTWLSHMLDCQLYGMNPFGHHLTSLLLHAANAVLLFLLCQRMTRAPWRSALVAALFALHPLHVESVAWISERKDVLSMLFALLSALAYARHAECRQARFLWLSVALFGLGLMAKPMLVTLPFLFLLLDYWPLQRWRRPLVPLIVEKVPYFLLAAASCIATVAAQARGGAMTSFAVEPLSLRLANAPVACARYLFKTILPINLAAYYPLHSWPSLEVAGAALLLIVLTVVAIRLRSTQPALVVGWLWFLGALVPVIGLVQVGAQAMADRYHYLPGIGLFILAVWTARGRTAEICACLFLAMCATVTWVQVHYWTDSETLFRHAVAVTERNSIMESNLGKVLLLQNRIDDALPHLQRAVEYDPRFPLPHLNLGEAWLAKGQIDQALSQFEIQVSLTPDDARARFNFGAVLLDAGLPRDAAPQLQRAVELNPGAAAYHRRLADALRLTGHAAEAMGQYEKSLAILPSDAQSASSLAWMLATCPEATLRDGARAVQLAGMAVRASSPTDPKPMGILAAAYAEAGDFANARATGAKAVQLAEASNQPALTSVLRKQLDAYQAGKPYRDTP